MIKKVLPLFLPVVLTLSGCLAGGTVNSPDGAGPVWADSTRVKIITGTDLHFISPRIMDKGPAILKVTEGGDGKVTHYTPEITAAFFEEVFAAKPEVLLLSGDLTYNGELASHEDLVLQLEEVAAAGIKVLVLPGNHDIAIPFAYSFQGDKAYYTDSVTEAEFKALYGQFGYDEAQFKDPASFSYVHEMSDRLWLVMIDVNTLDNQGALSGATGIWLKSIMEAALGRGIQVISSTHQNVLTHNPRFIDGFKIHNAEEVKAILEGGNTLVNLSGHIHIQDITDNETGLIEIDTGSMAVADNSYGVIQLDADLKFSYGTRVIDVKGYAERHGLTDPNLLDFENYAREFFKATSAQRTLKQLAEADAPVTDEELAKMLSFASNLNLAYFSGNGHTISKTILEDEGYGLWKQYGTGMRLLEYMESITSGKVRNENRLELDLKARY